MNGVIAFSENVEHNSLTVALTETEKSKMNVNLEQIRAAMLEAAFEALENGWPFSSTENRSLRYHGNDRKVLRAALGL